MLRIYIPFQPLIENNLYHRVKVETQGYVPSMDLRNFFREHDTRQKSGTL